MKKRFSEEQIIGILREGEVEGAVIRDICHKHNMNRPGIYRHL
ncbi:transposase [Nitrosovibrio tenuis]|uniref:Putative transposase n=1 Tax=Nitrosovibrio tenuis TaxID=1233 RepID=A0A1H7MZ93_9PROT|nr:putative transposase [Nitrosovibrio tenuis]